MPESPVESTTQSLKALWTRTVLAAVLLAFLAASAVVGPGRMPADEVRAGYAAAGLLCAPDEDGQPHRDAHCVLCLLPSTGAGPEVFGCDGSAGGTPMAVARAEIAIFGVSRAKIRHARAPPSSIV